MLEPLTRIYLAGQVRIDCERASVHDWRLVGRQGRLAFAFLCAEHGRAIARDELVDELWPDNPPPSADRALSAVLSKVRTTLDCAGLPPFAIATAFGCYQLRPPAPSWIDIDAAAEGIDRAEGLIRAHAYRDAWGHAQVAAHISRRPFLVGDDGPWASRTRGRMKEIQVRACECLSEIYIWSGEPANAARYAQLAIEAEPFRETAYQLLMRAHHSAGNRAEALRVYDRCRALLSEELGVSPSEQTEAVYEGILRA